jgi:hypothetical protein
MRSGRHVHLKGNGFVPEKPPKKYTPATSDEAGLRRKYLDIKGLAMADTRRAGTRQSAWM